MRRGTFNARALSPVSAAAFALASALASPPAHADELRVHALGGVAHAVGDPQQQQFGFGGGGGLALELPLARVLGVQIEGGGLALAAGDAPSDRSLASKGTGTLLYAMGGVRLRPWGALHVAGLWLDANTGLAQTGSRSRFGFDAHVGYDFRLGQGTRWDLGPFVGYTHVVQPDSSLAPEDAHILWLGVQVGLGAREDAPPIDHDRDRDRDGIFDPRDACPDVPGVHTDDPRTDGCPRGDQDKDGVFDDDDACLDVPGLRTGDPKTNGCPRGDRDKDTVFDDEDACPDVPGIRTSDPKTSGCPESHGPVRIEGDKIVLDEVILFGNDSPRVKHVSYGIVKKVAEFIDQNPDVMEIDISGYADAVGTEAHNLMLSRHRAVSVMNLLVKFGVAPSRLTTHAFGEAHPRVEVAVPERRSAPANRRVELTVVGARPAQTSPTSSSNQEKRP